MNNREFAVEVVQQLRQAGFIAYWAGGCVRDSLLGLEPKDYDVATDAQPEDVRRLFGKRRTRFVGAAFGVVLLSGPRGVDPIEVATFREDGVYSDGRRPDDVIFSTPERDAQRRDFTINGIFYDPLEDRHHDFVGGQEDLKRNLIRAIGEPLNRITEDKLRMVRAVRFAARFDYAIEAETLAAIQDQSATLPAVSAERVSGELHRMFKHASRVRALELLLESGLWQVILPEEQVAESNEFPWDQQLKVIGKFKEPSFAAVLAPLLRNTFLSTGAKLISQICKRWRLSNETTARIQAMLSDQSVFRNAETLAWPKVQRVLAQPRQSERLDFAAAVCEITQQSNEGIEFCRNKLALGDAIWNPPVVLTGDDLIAAGWRPGPQIRHVLDAVRDAQLNGEITTEKQAIELAEQLRAE